MLALVQWHQYFWILMVCYVSREFVHIPRIQDDNVSGSQLIDKL
jgi:hypothetical protein